MKVVYQCFGGTHSSVVASSIHLGLLPAHRIAEPSEILKITRFDATTEEDLGVPFQMGIDDMGNEIYVLGVGKARKYAVKAFSDVMGLLGVGKDELMIVPTLSAVGSLTRVGGFLSREMLFTYVGRPLVIRGVRHNYSKLAQVALKCKQELEAKTRALDGKH